MFKGYTERFIVGVLTTIILTAIYALWDAVQELHVGFGVPRGAVLVFHDRSGCSEGWADMGEEWRGLVAVAAASNTNDSCSFGRTGGAETHALTVDQIPEHSHQFQGEPFAGGGWGGERVSPLGTGDSVTHGLEHTPAGTIDVSGGSQPHNNMPPYIGLCFCKRQ